jgi:hypothetical protein
VHTPTVTSCQCLCVRFSCALSLNSMKDMFSSTIWLIVGGTMLYFIALVSMQSSLQSLNCSSKWPVIDFVELILMATAQTWLIAFNSATCKRVEFHCVLMWSIWSGVIPLHHAMCFCITAITQFLRMWPVIW